jgi:hypothetical protein
MQFQGALAKWKRRETVADLPTGPKEAKSTVLSIEEEALIVAIRLPCRRCSPNGFTRSATSLFELPLHG